MAEDKAFKLKLTGEGLAFDQTVSPDVARKILNLVLGGQVSSADSASRSEDVENGFKGGATSPKQFMADKRPATEIERVVCLAYYLTHFRNTPRFKTRDITDLNTEAAQPRLSNPSASARNATNVHCLSLAGAGEKQITPRGEELVGALPDREKVKDALDAHPVRRRAKKKKNSQSK